MKPMEKTLIAEPAPAALASSPDLHRPIASPWHTLLLIAIQAFLSYRGRAGHLNPDRIALYERTMFFEWMMLGLVLLGVWWHGSSLLSVLGARWGSVRAVLRDLGIAILFLIVTIALGSFVGSLFPRGAHSSAAGAMLPQGRTELCFWIALSLSAGICEEGIYRGYLQRQFGAFTKSVPAGILLSAIAFGSAHSYQGLRQAVQIGILGALGGILAYLCRSLRPGMIAHTLQDVLGGFGRH